MGSILSITLNESGPVTVHSKAPSLAVPSAGVTVSKFFPPSWETDIFIFTFPVISGGVSHVINMGRSMTHRVAWLGDVMNRCPVN